MEYFSYEGGCGIHEAFKQEALVIYKWLQVISIAMLLTTVSYTTKNLPSHSKVNSLLFSGVMKE